MDNKIIFTIDFDSFFASCEELRNQDLKQVPFVVGETVVSTSNYEARKYGIKSGMPIFKAKKLYNDLLVLKVDMDFYSDISKTIFSFIKKMFPLMEKKSIDECHIDATSFYLKNQNKDIAFLAEEIKNKIFEKIKLTCSIGISSNKVLSKIASKINKPNGVYSIFPNEIKEKLWPLDIINIYSLGKSSNVLFNKFGIYKIKDLANLKKEDQLYKDLKREMGINLDSFIDISNGIGSNKLDLVENENKSLSKEITFSNNKFNNPVQLKNLLSGINNDLLKRIKEERFLIKGVSIIYKNSNEFKKYKISLTLPKYTNKKEEIWLNIEKIFNDNLINSNLKLIGISFFNLKKEYEIYKQLNILDNDNIKRKTNIEKILTETKEKLNIKNLYIGDEFK